MSDDLRLDKALRDAFAAMSAAKGDCPDREELVQFHSGTLDPPRANQIQTHALRCAECNLILDKLDRFDQVVNDDAGIRGAIERSQSARKWSSWFSAYWKPVLAGSFVTGALLSIPLVQYRRDLSRLSSGDQAQSRSAELTQIFSLSQDRSTSVRALDLSDTKKSVVLSFFAPMAIQLRYTATIEDQAGKPVIGPVDISSEKATGRVNLLVSAASIHPGRYVVRVTEHGDTPGVLEVLAFEVVR